MILFDTCTLLWLVLEPAKLSAKAVASLNDAREERFVSAISAFEIGTLYAKKRIALNSPPEIWIAEAIADYSLRIIPISWEIALQSTQLPSVHSDPADRLILATALSHNLPIVSPDKHFSAYPGVRIIW